MFRNLSLTRSKDAGFTAAELLVVLALSGSVLAIAFGFFQSARATFQGDSDMRVVEWQLKLARETAINQRRAVEIRFTSPNLITVVRRNIGAGPATTVISTIYLEHNMHFMQFPGIPDTPDAFGATAPIAFGGAATIMFTADGMFTDGGGNPINGTVFIGQPGKAATARALTVFGPTARIRGFRWNGTQWRQ
jgi:prepilin-type N-terminal cleavage/methylation domain-containing protein